MESSATDQFKPELLAPAGNLEKLKIACLYGADAVYLGGLRYGLRSGADNFTIEQIKSGTEYAHAHGVKVYVVLNAFLHTTDFEGLIEYAEALEEISVDSLIISDLGVLSQIRDHCKIPLHLSTQASCLNVASAKQWKKLGACRIITGRELSLEEAAIIRKEADIEIEMFIHGAMCSAYSGNCTISNYTAGRDSNRGGCKQSCRFSYKIDGLDEEKTFMSSKDLMGLELIPQFISSKVDSLKIEGRMKSNLYVASTCKAYRKAIDELYKKQPNSKVFANSLQELNLFSNRGYTEAALSDSDDASSLSNERSGEHKFNFTGTIIKTEKEKTFIRLKNPIKPGDCVEILNTDGENLILDVNNMQDFSGHSIKQARQDQVIAIKSHLDHKTGMVLRKKIP